MCLRGVKQQQHASRREPRGCSWHFFGHQMPVTASRKKKEQGLRRGEGQRGGRQRGGEVPLFKSCHVALIHPASLERGKGPEGLSQDRAQAQTHANQKYAYTHCLSFSLAHTYTQMQFLSSSLTHTQTRRHTYTDDTGTWRSAGAVWGIENCLLRKALAN